MKKLENGLLIGNGLNRCLDADVSWNNLLEDIARDHGVKCNGSIPFPMEFENVVNQYQIKKGKEASDKIYLDIKKEIAEKVKEMKLPVDSVHNELKRLEPNLDLLMTTNYDSLLERTFKSDYQFQKEKTKTTKNICSTLHIRSILRMIQIDPTG